MSRPNIILLMTDQLRGDCLGYAGHPDVKRHILIHWPPPVQPLTAPTAPARAASLPEPPSIQGWGRTITAV